MALLTDSSLEFAREHITRFYDSDFFPKPFEFDAIWHSWDEIKKELMSKNVGKMFLSPPRAMTVPKAKRGFRVVHQLEPLEALIYAAMTFEITPAIEQARVSAKDRVACSYRFKVENGSFFATGSGWKDFSERSEELAKAHSHVLVTDITDFYNQIALHRLNNAIESANGKLKHIADDIEHYLTTINGGPSKGVPVGPAASIVMAEAIMIDVDRFISDLGVLHTRYVDDIRLFGHSEASLLKILERLTMYLHETHRLTVSSEKTQVSDAATFLQRHLHNPYIDEKTEVLDRLHEFSPYSEYYSNSEGYDDEPDDDGADLDDELVEAIEHVINADHLDLSLARSVIRSSRRNSNDSIAEHLLDNFALFTPVINDVVLYLEEITTDYEAYLFRPYFETIIDSAAADSQLVRFWTEFYITGHENFMASDKLRQYILNGPNVENKSRMAMTTKNHAWVRDQKNNIHRLGSWERRSVLNASRILSSDERNHWLKLSANSPHMLDRWVASWVRDIA